MDADPKRLVLFRSRFPDEEHLATVATWTETEVVVSLDRDGRVVRLSRASGADVADRSWNGFQAVWPYLQRFNAWAAQSPTLLAPCVGCAGALAEGDGLSFYARLGDRPAVSGRVCGYACAATAVRREATTTNSNNEGG